MAVDGSAPLLCPGLLFQGALETALTPSPGLGLSHATLACQHLGQNENSPEIIMTFLFLRDSSSGSVFKNES